MFLSKTSKLLEKTAEWPDRQKEEGLSPVAPLEETIEKVKKTQEERKAKYTCDKCGKVYSYGRSSKICDDCLHPVKSSKIEVCALRKGDKAIQRVPANVKTKMSMDVLSDPYNFGGITVVDVKYDTGEKARIDVKELSSISNMGDNLHRFTRTALSVKKITDEELLKLYKELIDKYEKGQMEYYPLGDLRAIEEEAEYRGVPLKASIAEKVIMKFN